MICVSPPDEMVKSRTAMDLLISAIPRILKAMHSPYTRNTDERRCDCENEPCTLHELLEHTNPYHFPRVSYVMDTALEIQNDIMNILRQRAVY